MEATVLHNSFRDGDILCEGEDEADSVTAIAEGEARLACRCCWVCIKVNGLLTGTVPRRRATPVCRQILVGPPGLESNETATQPGRSASVQPQPGRRTHSRDAAQLPVGHGHGGRTSS